MPNPFYNDANTKNPNKIWNYYGEFFHQLTVSENGQSYAISFDDQGGFSTTLSNPTSNTAPTSVNVTLLPVRVSSTVAVGAGAGGGPHVRTFDPAGAGQLDFFAYDSALRTGVHVAMGDVNADGVKDVITAPSAGGGPHIRVFDGTNGNVLYSFFAYDPGFRGGVNVSSGDIDRDGVDDIIAGLGGGPHVKVFSGRDGTVIMNYFAYDSSFRGGVTVASGDFDGDALDDLVTGPGPGGGPEIRVIQGLTGQPIISFFGADSSSRSGFFIAAGDANADGTDDILVGTGNGYGPTQVAVFTSPGKAASQVLTPYMATFTGGARVGVTEGKLGKTIFGAGPGGGPLVKYGDLSFFAFDPSFLGGIYVAG